jgi:hypothetical protein
MHSSKLLNRCFEFEAMEPPSAATHSSLMAMRAPSEGYECGMYTISAPGLSNSHLKNKSNQNNKQMQNSDMQTS